MVSVELGALSRFTDGVPEQVTLSGRDLVVVRRGDAVYVLRNRCPHQGALLSEGHLTGFVPACRPGEQIAIERAGEIIVCPWHGWEFDVRTGRSLCDPENTRVRAYAAHVVDGCVVVDID
jgi:nitrite reductase/ring-hydroxylating ferredoxin subunit